MKRTYNVTCTVIYNGSLKVEAENADEAMRLAEKHIDEHGIGDLPYGASVGDASFSFGELTVDYAETDCDEDVDTPPP